MCCQRCCHVALVTRGVPACAQLCCCCLLVLMALAPSLFIWLVHHPSKTVWDYHSIS